MKGALVVPRSKGVVPPMKQSEEKLRARIRKAFLAVSGGRSDKLAEILEDQLMNLMDEYAAAPKSQRDEIYLRAEERILQTARKLRSEQ